MFSLSLSLKTLIRRTLEVTLHSCLIIERRRELKMMRFMCLVLALSLFSAHGASVGKLLYKFYFKNAKYI